MRQSNTTVALVMMAFGAVAPVQAQFYFQGNDKPSRPKSAVNSQASYSGLGAGFNRRLNVGAGTSIQSNSRADELGGQGLSTRAAASTPGNALIGDPMMYYYQMMKKRKAAREQFMQQSGRMQNPHNTVYGGTSSNGAYSAAFGRPRLLSTEPNGAAMAARYGTQGSFVHPNWQQGSSSPNSTQLSTQYSADSLSSSQPPQKQRIVTTANR